ncbi:hypothetical protein B566_EDAN012995 [Ephemera danica]|nr:hypothetical protein B566_EDAN012995 [Ephemera danica]
MTADEAVTTVSQWLRDVIKNLNPHRLPRDATNAIHTCDQLDTLHIDLRKAFDRVPHLALKHILNYRDSSTSYTRKIIKIPEGDGSSSVRSLFILSTISTLNVALCLLNFSLSSHLILLAGMAHAGTQVYLCANFIKFGHLLCVACHQVKGFSSNGTCGSEVYWLNSSAALSAGLNSFLTGEHSSPSKISIPEIFFLFEIMIAGMVVVSPVSCTTLANKSLILTLISSASSSVA